MSKAKKILEELRTVPTLTDTSRDIKVDDVPDTIMRALGIPKKDIKLVSVTTRTYDFHMSDLGASVINNLASLGRHLTGIRPNGDRLVLSVKKDWKSYE